MASDAEKEYNELKARLKELQTKKRLTPAEKTELDELDASLEGVPNAKAYQQRCEQLAQAMRDVDAGNVVGLDVLGEDLKRRGIIKE